MAGLFTKFQLIRLGLNPTRISITRQNWKRPAGGAAFSSFNHPTSGLIPGRQNLKKPAGEAAISSFNQPTSTTVIDELKATLSKEVPLCTGVIPLDANNSQLFYRNAADWSLGFIDFSTTVSDAQLEHLAQACQPFGVQQQHQDVLDESYRKKNPINYSTNFNPSNTGIMQNIHGLLLRNPESPIRAELHKLNVYGPGFKSHIQVDTPRSPKMFGSLVVVLPTKHEGGAFSLRHHGQKWVFNSADLVSPRISESPRAAFVAFLGNVEREISVVNSGHQVTLTYNLYSEDDKSTIVPSTILPIDDTEVKVKKSLMALLNNRKFLPDGGFIGFGLSHLYPIDPNRGINLDELGKSLKGSDAAIKRACDSLSLEVSVNTIYSGDNDVDCLLEELAYPGSVGIKEDIALHLQKESSGLLVYDPEEMSLDDVQTEYEDARPIKWLRPLIERDQLQAPYVSYDSLEYVYGEICLVVEVEASRDREIYL